MTDQCDRLIAALSRLSRVLFVDDEDVMQFAYTGLASKFRFEAILATTGEEALAILNNPDEQIDFVFLDIKLPGRISGEDLFRIIKQSPMSQLRPSLPVAIVSGYIDAALVESLRRVGFSCFIAKPSSITEDFIGEMLAMFRIIPTECAHQDISSTSFFRPAGK